MCWILSSLQVSKSSIDAENRALRASATSLQSNMDEKVIGEEMF